ncbi:MAG: glutamate synthase-related protein [Dehalococcoidia bacterium]|nr:glutamate synthase-related protein [Dehalococcoidia bacterium]
MPKKYHIHTKPTPLNLEYLFKFRIVRGDNCINCGKCTKVCIYEAHKRRTDDPRRMAEPNTVVCRNCFRCIQECPRGALEKSIRRDFSSAGGAFWKPDMLLSLWKQAEDGRVPVSGAGYRGPFTGSGFDSMWTDMSEIVRPTRDGIHGREYINTSVDLGRRLSHLVFDEEGRLLSEVPHAVDIPIPVLFEVPEAGLEANVRIALVKAAAEIGTCIVMSAGEISDGLAGYAGNIIPRLVPAEIGTYRSNIEAARLVAIGHSRSLVSDFPRIAEEVGRISRALIIVRVLADRDVEETVVRLALGGAGIIHIVADWCGREMGSYAGSRRALKDIIRSVHARLVEKGIRDEVTLIASGGIAMAEHVPKAMLCGADLTAVDTPLLVAVGARIHEEPEERLILPAELAGIPVAALAQRMVNLMGAWHSQILEVMGAMGIREARRLRGESGRAIFFEEVDKDTFGRLFRSREAVGT